MLNDTVAGLLQVAALLILLALIYRPFGDYMARMYDSDRHWKVERLLYRLVRVDPDAEQRWTTYAAGLLGFSFVSVVIVYLLQRLQAVLPMSFDRGAVDPSIAMNTAISFMTNTNWQSYVPETTLGNTVQAAGLTVQNVMSAAVGMAVAVALTRGFARSTTDRIGNFWVDLTRGTIRVLLPISFVAAILLIAMGVTMSVSSGVDITAVDGSQHTIPMALTAFQEAIKELGTNGGGIYNANSAHPFENPNALSNFFEIFLLLSIPVCMTRTFGVMVGNVRQGHVLVAVMGALWGLVLTFTWLAETHPNGPATLAAGAAMEGKEVRLGVPASVLFATSTTGTSTGAVNSLHDSFTGGGGGLVLLHILFGELSPGGTGTGLYSILVVAIIAVFLAGLMVGRTPEYLGKKLGRREVTFASISILAMPLLVLLGTGLAIALPDTASAMNNGGEHGFSEVLYAYASAANNNGSAFAGITVTSDFFQTTLAVAMLFGRLVPILAVLGLAGVLAEQRKVEAGAGTLPTDGALFAVLVGGTVLLVAALTFFPALALGPIAEALS